MGREREGNQRRKESEEREIERKICLHTTLSLLQEREELAEIDLRKVTELRPPDPSGGPEAQCTFQIFLPERVYLLKADTPQEADCWLAALKHTQVRVGR